MSRRYAGFRGAETNQRCFANSMGLTDRETTMLVIVPTICVTGLHVLFTEITVGIDRFSFHLVAGTKGQYMLMSSDRSGVGPQWLHFFQQYISCKCCSLRCCRQHPLISFHMVTATSSSRCGSHSRRLYHQSPMPTVHESGLRSPDCIP